MAQREVDAVVKGAMVTMTEKGNAQVEIAFTVEADGSTIRRYGSLNGGALQYTVKDLRTCGWTGDDLDDLSSVGGGLAVTLVLDEEEYNGRTREKVKFVNRRRLAAPAGIGAQLRARIAALPKPEQDFGGADDFKVG